MMFACRSTILACGVLLFNNVLQAQQPAAPLPETKVVLRISRDLIHELTGIHFNKNEPIATNSGGADVAGNAIVDGGFDVKLKESENESDFDLHIAGNVLTQITATRRPVYVHTHGVAPFSACCRVVFDGHTFSRQPVQVCVSNQFTLDEIASFRGGIVGALTRRVARPIVQRGLRDGERETAGQIHTQVAQSFAEAADTLVAKLNKIDLLVQRVKADLKKAGILTQDELRHYHAATQEYLWFSVGKPDHRMPILPDLDVTKRAPIELWITSKDARLERLIKDWKIVEPLVLERIAKRSPELSQIILRARVETVPGWHIVRFTPDLAKLPKIELPE